MAGNLIDPDLLTNCPEPEHVQDLTRIFGSEYAKGKVCKVRLQGTICFAAGGCLFYNGDIIEGKVSTDSIQPENEVEESNS